jgi:DNA repair exonuclease SbcCD ATPase subunit
METAEMPNRRIGEDTAPPESPPRPTSGKHDIHILVIELSEHVHEHQKLLVRHGVESDQRWSELRQGLASQQNALRRLSDQARLQGADLVQIKAQLATISRDVAAILEMIGGLTREMGARATHDSVQDIDAQADREKLDQQIAALEALKKTVEEQAKEKQLARYQGALGVGGAGGGLYLLAKVIETINNHWPF